MPDVGSLLLMYLMHTSSLLDPSLLLIWSRSYSPDPHTFSFADLCASGSHWCVRHSLQEGRVTFFVQTCRQGCSPILCVSADGKGWCPLWPCKDCSVWNRGAHFSHCQARQRALCQRHLGRAPGTVQATRQGQKLA